MSRCSDAASGALSCLEWTAYNSNTQNDRTETQRTTNKESLSRMRIRDLRERTIECVNTLHLTRDRPQEEQGKRDTATQAGCGVVLFGRGWCSRLPAVAVWAV